MRVWKALLHREKEKGACPLHPAVAAPLKVRAAVHRVLRDPVAMDPLATRAKVRADLVADPPVRASHPRPARSAKTRQPAARGYLPPLPGKGHSSARPRYTATDAIAPGSKPTCVDAPRYLTRLCSNLGERAANGAALPFVAVRTPEPAIYFFGVGFGFGVGVGQGTPVLPGFVQLPKRVSPCATCASAAFFGTHRIFPL